MSKPITHEEFAAQLVHFRHHSNPTLRKRLVMAQVTHLDFAGGIPPTQWMWNHPYGTPQERRHKFAAHRVLRRFEQASMGSLYDLTQKRIDGKDNDIARSVELLRGTRSHMLEMTTLHRAAQRKHHQIAKCLFVVIDDTNAEMMFKLTIP